MSTIKALGIQKIKELGLNNVNGTDTSLPNSLTIKYISCKQKGISLTLKFDVEAKNCKETKAYLNVFWGDVSTNALSSESVTKLVEINPNGRKSVEIDVPLSFAENVYNKTNKYYRASVTVDGIFALSEGFEIKVKPNEKDVCYCFKQSLTKASCSGKGKNIIDEMYINLAQKLGVEKEVFLAIAKQGSGHDPFVQNNPKKANILLERHFVYRLLKHKFGKGKADSLKNVDSSFCHEDPSLSGTYGTRLQQLVRIEKVKKWDKDVAIKSCSWGRFQTMGEYFSNYNSQTYKDAEDFEIAMNMCEVQHFSYFSFFIEKVKGKNLVNAMKNKNWEDIAKYYNGSKWQTTNPNYAKNLKKYYEEYKNH